MSETEYLLICLMEEAAEIQQIAAKCLRFGLGNHHPDHPEITNKDELRRELVDLDAIHAMLMTCGALPFECSEYQKIVEKTEKVKHYMDVSRACGTLAKEDNHEKH